MMYKKVWSLQFQTYQINNSSFLEGLTPQNIKILTISNKSKLLILKVKKNFFPFRVCFSVVTYFVRVKFLQSSSKANRDIGVGKRSNPYIS